MIYEDRDFNEKFDRATRRELVEISLAMARVRVKYPHLSQASERHAKGICRDLRSVGRDADARFFRRYLLASFRHWEAYKAQEAADEIKLRLKTIKRNQNDCR